MRNKLQSFLTLFIVITMIISSIPVPAVNAESKKEKEAAVEPLSEGEEYDEVEPIEEELLEGLEPGDEIVEKRTETSKLIYNGDDTLTEEIYFNPIHKKGEDDDTFEEISTEFVEDPTSEEEIETENTTLQAKFRKKMKKGKYAKFTIGEHTLSYSLLEASGEGVDSVKPKDVKATFEGNTVTYEEVFPNTDLRNVSFDQETKEDFILHSYEGLSTFSFHIKTKLTGEITENGELKFVDEDETPIFTVPKPYMEDSNYDDHKGEAVRSDKIEYQLEEAKNGYILSVVADEDWLTDPERQYPVYIDPSISVGNTMDTFVMSPYPTTNYNSGKWDSGQGQYTLKVGYYDSGSGRVYAYLQPNTSGLTPEAGYMVNSAKLKVYVTHHYYANNPNGLWVDYVNSSWNASTLTWSNKPSSTNITSVNVGREQWATFDVTNIVKDWNKGKKTNYGFKLHTNGNGQEYWKKVVSGSNSTLQPKLEITYTTLAKATAPTVKAYSSGKNTTTGYLDISWNKVTGADGYKVAIFNGKAYQYYDVGNVTSWSTKGKKLWPTNAEIERGNYALHTDGRGAELPNNPIYTYIASGGNYQTRQNYWIRIVAYNKEFGVETPYSDSTRPIMPDSTPPNQLSKPTVTVKDGALNSGNSAEATVSWNAAADLPATIGSGINYYEVQKKVNGSWSAVTSVKSTGGSKYSYTVKDLPDDGTIAFKVRAFDNKGNYTSYSTSSDYKTKDRTRPSTPSAVSVTPSDWSTSNDYSVTWKGITDNTALASIQYKLDDQPWDDIGSTSRDGTKRIPNELTDGVHTIQIRGIDREGNTGLAKSAKLYKDTDAPIVSFDNPKQNETVKGIEEVRVRVHNLTPQASYANLIHNGEFLNGLDGWTEVRSNDDGSVSNEGETDVETLALKLSPNSSSSQEDPGYLAATYEIEVKPNATYRLRGKVKTDLENASARFKLKIMKKDGHHVEWIDSEDHVWAGVNNWSEDEHTFTTPSDARRVKLYLQVDHQDEYAKGSAWFDSIYFEEWNEETQKYSASLVDNGDFTSGVGGWTTVKKHDFGRMYSPPKSFEKTMTLKINPSASSNGGYLGAKYEVEVKPNTTYRLRGNSKTDLEGANAYFKLKIMKKDGKHLEWIDSEDHQLTGMSEWTEHDHTFTTPEDARQIQIFVMADHQDPAAKGVALFDSIMLQELEDDQTQEAGEYTWTLAYGEGSDPDHFTTLTEGTSTSEEINYSWNTSDLVDDRVYTLKFTATDEAGNDTTKTTSVLNSKDTSSIEPLIKVTNPERDQTVTNETQSVEYVASPNAILDVLNYDQVDLFVNSKLVDKKETAADELSFDATQYPENSLNQLYVRGKDASGQYHYSTYAYQTEGIVDLFETEEKIAKLSSAERTDLGIQLTSTAKTGMVESTAVTVPGDISTILLTTSEEKPSGTSISYEASADGGKTWDAITLNEPFALSHSGSELKVKATLSTATAGVSPRLQSWDSEIVYVNTQGHSFKVKLIDEPKNVSATPNVNYMTLLRWDASATKDVTYSIYRSATPDFTPSEATLVEEGVRATYWNDYNLNYGQTFYYQVVAVKELNGTSRHSVASNEAKSQVVSKEELEKHLGLQDYWSYSSFPTARGEGYVNIASGNLVYQSSDFVHVSPQLAMVMRRSFNSQSTTKTPLGYGWDFSFNTTLLKEFNTDGEEIGLILKDGDGSLHRFAKKEDGTYETPKGVHMTLTKKADGSYEILRTDQVKYVFDGHMKLMELTEPNGNSLVFFYESTRGNLTHVINNLGEQTYLFYDYKDRLKKIVDPSDRVYHFEYDESSDRLKKTYQVIKNEEYAETYVYNEEFTELQGLIDAESYETKLQYEDGKVRKVTDSIGEYSSFTYDGEKTTITTDKGKEVSFTVNADGNITSKTNPDNHQIHYEYTDDMLVDHVYYDNTIDGEKKTLHHRYTYDDRGNILTTTDPLGNITEFKDYNEMNLVGEVITPISEGVTSTSSYEYDARGNVLTSTDPAGRTISYTYDDFGNQKTTTNEFDQTTTYEYDRKGRVTKINEPLGKVTEIMEYDSQGNPVKIKDPEGNIIESKYDVLDRLIQSTDAKGYTVKQTYDLNHNLLDVTNQRGFVTTFKYDAVGRLKKTIYPNEDEEEISYQYDENNNEKIVYTDGEGRTSTQYFDEVGRLVKEEAFNAATMYEYDDVGNMTKVTDGEGRVAQSVYDELGRQTEIIVDPAGKNVVTKNVFDLQGNAITSIDPEGNTTDYEYDQLNRLKKVNQTVDGESLTTSYAYDKIEGDYVKNTVTDALGREKATYLDALGRVFKEVNEGTTGDSDKMEQTFKYDLNGNLVETVHNDGSIVTKEYDERNLVTKVTYGDKQWTTYEYDANGNREKMVDSNDGKTITSTYSFDTNDRLTQETQDGTIVNYQYDASDNVTKVYYPTEDGDQQKDIDYVYDEYSRLESILVEGKKVQDVVYNAAAQVDYAKNYLKFDTNGSDYVKIDYVYDTLGQTESIGYFEQGTKKLEEYQLTFDQRGFIKNEEIYTNYGEAKTVQKAYQYNEAGQLKESTIDNKTTSYTYDAVGNRKTMTEGSDSFSYSYNQFNQLKTTTKNGSPHATYEYDGRGNQQKEIIKKDIDGQIKDVTTNYTYDQANQLSKVETITPGKETSITKSFYNGDGQRIRRDVNGLVTKYIYDDDAILYTTDEDNRKVTENVLSPIGAIISSKRFDGNYANNYFFYHYDSRGSVTNVLDPEAKRVKGYEYDDFGNSKEVGDKTFKNDVKFTGAVHDASTGLHYMNARYYSSETGRFISQDTYKGNAYDPWTQHLYTYTTNNPINFVDPTGHYAVDPDGNKILSSGAYVPNVPRPERRPPTGDKNKVNGGNNSSVGHKSTTSGSKKSKPSKKHRFLAQATKIMHKSADMLGIPPDTIKKASNEIQELSDKYMNRSAFIDTAAGFVAGVTSELGNYRMKNRFPALITDNYQRYAKPFAKSIGRIAPFASAIFPITDIVATINDPDLSTGKKALKIGIIQGGFAGSFYAGTLSGAAATGLSGGNLVVGAAAGIAVGTSASYGIAKGQSYLYNKWELN
ncbi:DNRLRE domain-containing protein [Bacillus spongiae]|uniref:DNRLRE domain-containing protein n=1 Tax=Bacillus spongiae TaxID=2683610 RepID=A0ABU8HGK8_9BACI